MSGVAYSVKVKREIAALLAAGVSASAVSRDYGINLNTLKNFPKEIARLDAKQEAYRAAKESVLPASALSPSPKKDGDFFVPTLGAEYSKTTIQDPTRGIDIMVIGDMQVKPGIDLGYCERVGRYAADEKPHTIVCIGDFADMGSHSFHDEPGSKAFSAQNYKDDILATHLAMKGMMTPIKEEMARTAWKPRLVMCMGNHEHRITRTLEKIPKLDGTLGLQDLEYERWGWEVIPFLEQITIAGVTFSHYFPSGQMGRPISSARAILTKGHVSAIAGHQQGRDVAFGKRMDGKQITAIICGSTYEHDESYLNPQTNNHWRGFYILNDVVDGEFEEKAVSMKYLRRRYGA